MSENSAKTNGCYSVTTKVIYLIRIPNTYISFVYAKQRIYISITQLAAAEDVYYVITES